MDDIFVSDTGKGTPLVLVHGFLGSSKIWKPQIKFFQKNFRVLVPDLPGFGQNNKKKSFNNISSIAKLILKLLKKKKIKKYYLLGHSMGGMIVQEIVKIRPNNILKLICYSTGPIGEMPGRFETVDQSRENFKRKGRDETIKKIVKSWFVKDKKDPNFNICVDVANQASLKAINNSLIAFKKWNNLKNLKKIKNETLIIWGNQDKSYTIEQIKILKKKIKNSKLEIFKNCAHNVHLEQKKNFNIIVKKFLIDSSKLKLHF